MEKLVQCESTQMFNVRLSKGLELLWEAYQAAQALNRDPWQFAVEIGNLHDAGLTNSDLRWLLCRGLVQHAAEEIRDGLTQRTFQPLTSLSLPAGSCFILTAEGLQVLASQADPLPPGAPAVSGAKENGSNGSEEKPHWDRVRRRLTWKGRLIKEFRLPAENQEAILDQLEAEGWPPRIDDPLERLQGVDRKARLHDAIKGLNRNQVNRLLLFQGDGTTRGVFWTTLEDE